MLFAKVVFGLPIDGPFDYFVPQGLARKLVPGSRVGVSFGAKKRMIGYCVGLVHHSNIKNLKNIQEIIDEIPVLSTKMLKLTKELSLYYCCSWGEAIETALPQALRRGRKIELKKALTFNSEASPSLELVHSIDVGVRWETYLSQINDALVNKRQALIIFADVESAQKAGEIINSKLRIRPQLLYRSQLKEAEAWQSVKEGRADLVVGTRSSVFAPLERLGLIIIDEEENTVYKQDQVPHYHARQVALMRALLEGTHLVFGSSAPSVESFYLAKKSKIKYTFLPKKDSYPQVRIVDLKRLPFAERKRNIVFTKLLEDEIASVLNSQGKVLLFLNRKGFATAAFCHNCATVLKCQRCNINLAYHYEENQLRCHYCNFKMELPKICPVCNAGYIKFKGTGTEKIESELSRVFPLARIKNYDGKAVNIGEPDILISTSAIIKQVDLRFDLIGVLAIDNSLNRMDLEASEKTFTILSGLLGLTDKKLLIQTHFPGHYAFKALLKNDPNLFYEEELKTRKELKFPPYVHFALVKLRAKNEERVKEASQKLFEKLNLLLKPGNIKVLSLNPGQPSKLRGNFYWQILISATSAVNLSKFLKKSLKDFSHSGIIVTVDVDPI